MIRTFVSVPVPEHLLSKAEQYQEYLKRLDAGVRWVHPQNCHVTLKFLGDVSPQQLSGLNFALKAALASETSFSAALGGSGTFPGGRNPRVVWVGLEQGASRVVRLANRVESAVAGLGFPREQRPFKPHVTIGRVKTPRNVAALMDTIQMNPFEGGKFSVEKVHLMKSVLTQEGAEYSVLETYKLRG